MSLLDIAKICRDRGVELTLRPGGFDDKIQVDMRHMATGTNNEYTIEPDEDSILVAVNLLLIRLTGRGIELDIGGSHGRD